MAYKYTKFGDLDMPTGNPEHAIGAGPVAAYVVPLPGGGAYDPLGPEQAWTPGGQISVRGVLVKDTVEELEAAYLAWRAALGTRNRLYRVAASSGREEWAYARLIQIDCPRVPDFPTALAVDLTFVQLSRVWNGADRDVDATLAAGTTRVSLANAGNARVANPRLTVTAVGGELTRVELDVSVGGTQVVDLSWAGTVAAGQALVIDCGEASVKNNGADAYAGLTYGSAHLWDDWLHLDPGTTTLSVIVEGAGVGSSTFHADYCDGWA